jgi:hypothetical protein
LLVAGRNCAEKTQEVTIQVFSQNEYSSEQWLYTFERLKNFQLKKIGLDKNQDEPVKSGSPLGWPAVGGCSLPSS